ncbi:MAG: hypothetical protein D6785_05690 [Planctomycetota bacterium]|nr:MAG: hypothetical protein D6785_05690 [Planctomycetota bacterium]
MKPTQLAGFTLIVAVLVLAVDFGFAYQGTQAALLFTLAVFTALVHGSMAIVVVAELCQAKWIQPIKKYLLSVYPLFIPIAIMFLFQYPRYDTYYGDAHGYLTNWMNPFFYFGRNLAALLLSCFVGWKYAQESLSGGSKKAMYGVFYVLLFVITNSFIAFDWIMPLEYPWFSTLYGGFFFIESLFTGVITCSIICFFLYRRYGKEIPKAIQKAQYDTGVLMFGFGILWCYLFFSQLIVIWYGNLPTEVIFFLRRVWGNPGHPSPYWPLSVAVVVINFLLPFTVLQFKRFKSNPKVLAPVGLMIFGGLLMERFIMIRPMVYIQPIALLLELVLVLTLFGVYLRSGGEREVSPTQ